jgi:hypothetical protein
MPHAGLQERLVDLRAAAKTSDYEDPQDLPEEHAVAAALLGLDMTQDPDRKPGPEDENDENECKVCIDAPKSHILVQVPQKVANKYKVFSASLEKVRRFKPRLKVHREF